MALLSDLTREQNRTCASHGVYRRQLWYYLRHRHGPGPIITHQLACTPILMIAANSGDTSGFLLTLWVVPNSQHHVLNRESGMVKGRFSKVLADKTTEARLALCACILC